MKITIDVDCTPEEARKFMGLPDMTALHDVYLDRVKDAMKTGVTADMIDPMIKSWGAVGEGGLALFQQLLGQMASGSAFGMGAKPARDKGKS